MFCSNCGHEVEENALFCGECGKKILTDVGAQTETQITMDMPKKRKFLFRRMCIVASIIMFASYVFSVEIFGIVKMHDTFPEICSYIPCDCSVANGVPSINEIVNICLGLGDDDSLELTNDRIVDPNNVYYYWHFDDKESLEIDEDDVIRVIRDNKEVIETEIGVKLDKDFYEQAEPYAQLVAKAYNEATLNSSTYIGPHGLGWIFFGIGIAWICLIILLLFWDVKKQNGTEEKTIQFLLKIFRIFSIILSCGLFAVMTISMIFRNRMGLHFSILYILLNPVVWGIIRCVFTVCEIKQINNGKLKIISKISATIFYIVIIRLIAMTGYNSNLNKESVAFSLWIYLWLALWIVQDVLCFLVNRRKMNDKKIKAPKKEIVIGIITGIVLGIGELALIAYGWYTYGVQLYEYSYDSDKNAFMKIMDDKDVKLYFKINKIIYDDNYDNEQYVNYTNVIIFNNENGEECIYIRYHDKQYLGNTWYCGRVTGFTNYNTGGYGVYHFVDEASQEEHRLEICMDNSKSSNWVPYNNQKDYYGYSDDVEYNHMSILIDSSAVGSGSDVEVCPRQNAQEILHYGTYNYPDTYDCDGY